MKEITVMGIEDIEMGNTPIDEIESEVVNLIFIGIDCSISMNRFVSDMKKSLQDFKDALTDSKEADEILIARADFSGNDISIGGYKKIEELNTDYSVRGMTPLYDVAVEGSDKLIKYMDTLRNNGMRVKAVFAIFSDGEDTSSSKRLADAVRAVAELNNKEMVF